MLNFIVKYIPLLNAIKKLRALGNTMCVKHVYKEPHAFTKKHFLLHQALHMCLAYRNCFFKPTCTYVYTYHTH